MHQTDHIRSMLHEIGKSVLLNNWSAFDVIFSNKCFDFKMPSIIYFIDLSIVNIYEIRYSIKKNLYIFEN